MPHVQRASDPPSPHPSPQGERGRFEPRTLSTPTSVRASASHRVTIGTFVTIRSVEAIGSPQRRHLSTKCRTIASSVSPSPSWGGVRGGGTPSVCYLAARSADIYVSATPPPCPSPTRGGRWDYRRARTIALSGRILLRVRGCPSPRPSLREERGEGEESAAAGCGNGSC